MSITAIGSRVAEIDQMVATVGGQVVPPTSTFASALQSAQGATQTSTATGTAGGDTPFGAEIDAAATRNGIDPALLKGLIRQESGFDPAARSGAGAVGLTQLMPGTAASLGVDPTDPAQAIDGGARYLKQQLDRFGGDASKALAAYNAGPGAVARYGGVPPYAETQDYVSNVLAFADQYRAAGTAAPVAALPATTTPVLAAPAATGASLDFSTL
ncbi:lytic transglycosylase domain-containing protein [Baekduia soli]|uniref:Lytic transglycosylase domain-containing protein n=1 Tax=Baekduia soli TaxID=496014 RepID=A0A5B8U1G0_9ACTN|nr:lytic transglycosylase domain-containing protein [Baekduia soli]QEC46841.1 lytic transglycosylase domain-containing protein [Baekduia soli]